MASVKGNSMKPWLSIAILSLAGAAFCGGGAAVFDCSAKAIAGAVFVGLAIGPVILEWRP